MRNALCDKEIAHLLPSVSLYSLRSARSNKPWLPSPPWEKVGGRVVYDRALALEWAKANRIPVQGVEGHREAIVEPREPGEMAQEDAER